MKSWFIANCINQSSTMMERILVKYAKENYLHHAISDDGLRSLAADLREVQERFFNENKRLKKVEIDIKTYQDIGWFRIGKSTLPLQEIVGTLMFAV